MRTLEQVRRVDKLLEITGNSFAEITEPVGGWPPYHKNKVALCSGEEFGKFFIQKGAIIDYMAKSHSVLNLQNYHPSLLSLAIEQLETTCVAVLEKKAKCRSFPNLHHLLLKYYGLTKT